MGRFTSKLPTLEQTVVQQIVDVNTIADSKRSLDTGANAHVFTHSTLFRSQCVFSQTDELT